MENEPIRFYFSFRSPYAWIATERFDAELGDLPAPVERIPIYPKAGGFPNDPTSLPDKLAYMAQDVPRLARELGLKVRFPPSPDTDWALSHAAFFEAESQGAGPRFMLEVYRKRFCEGLDLGDGEVIADAARRAGLDAEAILEAGHSEALREKAAAGWQLAAERDHVFGVPSFVYAGRLYWGQDRMRFLRAAVLRKSTAA